MEPAELAAYLLADSAPRARRASDFSLPPVIEWPTERLIVPSGSALKEVLSVKDNYYRLFRDLLSGSSAARRVYVEAMMRLPGQAHNRQALEGLAYRAAQILTSQRYGVSYFEADEYLRVTDASDLDFTMSEAVEIVIENYLSMASSPIPRQVLGEVLPDGRVRLIEGVHRAVMNLAQGHNFTPVAVIRRDPEWEDFVGFFRAESQALYDTPDYLYHAIDHPDFASFTIIREDRSGPIVDFVRQRGLKVGIDLGAMIGFYSHRLAREGIQMTAVEYEQKYADALERLSATYELDVRVRREDVLNCEYVTGSGEGQFVLMLSLLYHLLRRDATSTSTWLENLQGHYDCFVVDTEERTGILPLDRLLDLFPGFSSEVLFVGADDRRVVGLWRDLPTDGVIEPRSVPVAPRGGRADDYRSSGRGSGARKKADVPLAGGVASSEAAEGHQARTPPKGAERKKKADRIDSKSTKRTNS